MSNRKQRRALARKSRGRTPQLKEVADLLSKVEGYKEEISGLADKVAGDAQGFKFARLLCKLEPLVADAQLSPSDIDLLRAAKELVRETS